MYLMNHRSNRRLDREASGKRKNCGGVAAYYAAGSILCCHTTA
jgi:hypothetical protein